MLTWPGLAFKRENWRTVIASYHLGSRASVTATPLGIYFPHAHQVHLGFAFHWALLLNALGNYTVLCKVHFPKVWSRFDPYLSISLTRQNWDSWVWYEDDENEEEILWVWTHEQRETIIPFFAKKAKIGWRHGTHQWRIYSSSEGDYGKLGSSIWEKG